MSGTGGPLSSHRILVLTVLTRGCQLCQAHGYRVVVTIKSWGIHGK